MKSTPRNKQIRKGEQRQHTAVAVSVDSTRTKLSWWETSVATFLMSMGWILPYHNLQEQGGGGNPHAWTMLFWGHVCSGFFLWTNWGVMIQHILFLPTMQQMCTARCVLGYHIFFLVSGFVPLIIACKAGNQLGQFAHWEMQCWGKLSSPTSLMQQLKWQP